MIAKASNALEGSAAAVSATRATNHPRQAARCLVPASQDPAANQCPPRRPGNLRQARHKAPAQSPSAPPCHPSSPIKSENVFAGNTAGTPKMPAYLEATIVGSPRCRDSSSNNLKCSVSSRGWSHPISNTHSASGARSSSAARPAWMDVAIPCSQFSFRMKTARRFRHSFADHLELPAQHRNDRGCPGFAASRIARSSNVSPRSLTSCLGCPSRRLAPAARMMAAAGMAFSVTVLLDLDLPAGQDESNPNTIGPQGR